MKPLFITYTSFGRAICHPSHGYSTKALISDSVHDPAPSAAVELPLSAVLVDPAPSTVTTGGLESTLWYDKRLLGPGVLIQPQKHVLG